MAKKKIDKKESISTLELSKIKEQKRLLKERIESHQKKGVSSGDRPKK